MTIKRRHRPFGVIRRMASFVAGLIIIMLTGCGDGGGTVEAPSSLPSGTTAELRWDAPLTSADGTQLSDLAGFKVYYSTTTPLTKINSQNIDVGNTTAYTFDSLPAGTYYFAVAAYDLVNNESDLSDATTKIITGS